MSYRKDITAILQIIGIGTSEDDGYESYFVSISYDGLGYIPAIVPMRFISNKPRARIKLRKRIDDISTLATKVDFDNIKENNMLLDEIKMAGEIIHSKLGLRVVFNALYEQADKLAKTKSAIIKNLVIVTNETTIPWIWSFNKDKKEFLSETFSIGLIFVNDNMLNSTTISVQNENKHDLEGESIDPDALLKKQTMVLCFGINDEQNDKKTATVQLLHEEESRNIRQSVLEIFNDDNIEVFRADGDRFRNILMAQSPRLKLIHYSGPFNSGKMHFSVLDEPIDAETLNTGDLSLFKFHSNPIIFINSYHCQQQVKSWGEDADLANAFLCKGATNCIIPLIPVKSDIAIQFAKGFYRKLTYNQSSIGDAVRLTKIEQKNDQNLSNDVTRLFFNLYGDPRNKLSKGKSVRNMLLRER